MAERAIAAAKLANIKEGHVKSQHAPPIGGATESRPLISREEAAKKLGVGKSSVDRAKYVLDHGFAGSRLPIAIIESVPAASTAAGERMYCHHLNWLE
jgi:hypothetical protein